MKYLRLLNIVLAVAVASALAVGGIGIYRQYHGRKFAGWPAYVFMLCWGVVVMAFSAKAILRGDFRTRSGRTISRERTPVQFWISVGISSIAGIVVTGIGVFKLITRLL